MSFSGGTGVADDPWLIADAAQLNSIRDNPGACYQLIADVQLAGVWVPIPAFRGVLDGNGYKVTGLRVDYTSNHAGFFTQLEGNAQVTCIEFHTTAAGVAGSGSYYKAVVAGTVVGTCFLFRVIARGQVSSGGDRAGGLFGYISNVSTCIECGAFVRMVGGGSRLGADVGYNEGGWLVRSCAFSPSYSGAAGNIFSSNNDSASLANPGDKSGFPRVWNFARVWEIADGFPVLRKSDGPSAGYSYDLTLGSAGTRVDSLVRVEGSAAQRRVLAITEEAIVVSGPHGNQLQQIVVAQGVSTVEGVIELDLNGYEGVIWLLGLDDWGSVFVPDQLYLEGAVVRPTSAFNGRSYVCTSAGRVGSEPEWWLEGVRAVGTASFEARLYHRPLAHGPITPRRVE